MERVISSVLNFYEHYFMYRLKKYWGYAHKLKLRIPKDYIVDIVGYSRFLNPENITISNHVSIGYGCFFFGKGGIDIGEGTVISRNVAIYSANHDFRNTNILPFNSEYICEKVTVGKGVWIGMNVSILPGVNIGDGAIIGMGCVVASDVSKGEIVVSQKYRVISKRDITQLDESIQKSNFLI
jgi:acetyltransferase-like isoleucine patch superfamily enzyme